MILASIFKRLNYGDTALWVPGLAFVLFFSVFIFVAIKITRMPKKKARHLAELPLEKETKKPTDEAEK